MTDSEEETELPDHINVACAAEAVAIVAIGCVAGLKGLSKMRKEVWLHTFYFFSHTHLLHVFIKLLYMYIV